MEGPMAMAYNFEPEYTDEEMFERAAAAERAVDEPAPSPPEPVPVPDRLGNNDWCHCGNCVPMPSVLQCRCCAELQNCRRFLNDGVVCITNHEDFPKLCLERVVLRTALVARLDCRGHRRNFPEILDNISYRYAAYRLFTYWVHGYLGRGVRKVIPACAVTAIQRTFPAPDGHYIGFKEGDDGEEVEVPEEFAI